MAIHEEAVVLASADGMERLSFALEAPSFAAATPEKASFSSPLAAVAGPVAASLLVSESFPTAALLAALAAALAAAGLPARPTAARLARPYSSLRARLRDQ